MKDKNSNRLKKGDSYFRKKLYYEAYDQYNLGLRENPFSIILQIKLTLTQLKLGNTQQAINRFFCAINQAGANQLFNNYVLRHYKNINKNIGDLQRQLKSQYDIPIPQKPLKKLLLIIKNDIKESKEQEEFNQFIRKLPFRNFIILADYIETFIKHYDKDYKNHIPRFHQYLQNNYSTITISELEKLILKQKKIMKQPRWKEKSTFDMMTGKEFENFLYTLFTNFGYRASITKSSHDQGCDLLLEGRYGERTVIQAKRRKKNTGTSAIQEIYTAKKIYNASKAICIITKNFTKPAQNMAKKLNVELWDRQRLLSEMKKTYYW